MKSKVQASVAAANMRSCGHFIVSPFAIVLIASILYYLPVILLQVYQYDLFGLYRRGLKIQNPALSHGVVVLVLVFLIGAAKASFRPVFQPQVIRSDFLFWLLFWAYSCMAGLSLSILSSELELLGLVRDLFFEPVQFALNLALVGVKLSEGGLLRFYLAIHFLPVLWYIWSNNYQCDRLFFLRKLLLAIFFGLIFFVFVLLTRRELIIYLVLIMLVGFGGRVKKAYLLTILTLVALVSVYLISMRLGDVDFGLEMYFTSEEFYPFQLSLLLIDEWVGNPYLKNLIQIMPGVLLTDMPTVLSPSIMSEYFNHYGPGPTVGLPYAVIAFGVLYPCIYIMANFLFLNQIRTMISRCPENGRLIPLYAFLLLKLFLLVRNGEFFNHFLDSLIFVILYLPFIFITPRGQHETSCTK